MYPMFNSFHPTDDPIELNRMTSRRPATQLEILQRAQREDRLRWRAIADREARAEARERNPLQRVPNAIGSIVRSIRRTLSSDGERIGQQAA